MMNRMALCMLAVVACGPAGGERTSQTGVSVALDRDTYAPGDTVRVTVARGAEGEIVFAVVCDLFVEARCDTTWTTVFEPDCSNIRVAPTRLAAGDSVVTPFGVQQLPAECAPFRLRLRYQQMDNAGYRTAYSPEFAIQVK